MKPKRLAMVPLLCAAACLAGGGACGEKKPRPTTRPADAGSSETMATIVKRLGSTATVEQIAREAGKGKVAAAVTPLVNAIPKADVPTRIACLWAFGEIGDRAAIPMAKFYLRDKDPAVRRAAADALGKLGDADGVAGLLADGIGDKDPDIRRGSYDSLAKIATEKALEGLMNAFVDAEPAVRAAAARHVLLLGQKAQPHLAQAVALVAALPPQKDNRPHYEELVALLRTIATTEMVPHLVRLAGRTNAGAIEYQKPDASACQAVRTQIVDALASLGPRAAAPLADAAIDGFGRRSMYIKQVAADVFVRWGSPAVKPVADRILARETAHDLDELRLWVAVLEEIGDPNGQEALAKARRLLRGEKLPPPPDMGPNPAYVNDLPGGESATLARLPEPWHDVHVVLHGALPNSNPKLGRDEELYLARIAAVSPGAPPRWQPCLMGYSAFFHRGRRVSHFGYMDHEGTVLEAREDGNAIRLKVALELNDDPWAGGGRLSAEIQLTRAPGPPDDWRRGEVLTGSYTGEFLKRPSPVSGPGGRFKVSGDANGFVMRKCWPSPVAGWQPVRGDEHPRLIFRRADVPALRERAQTPTGRHIVARLTETLTRRGHWTLWHGMGYGMLWQLTGDRAYADLAREHTDHAVNGTRKNMDGRYSFAAPGGKLRAGSSYAAVAMAYDLCFDAWPEDYRRKIALAIQDKVWGDADSGGYTQAEPSHPGLVLRTEGGQHSPLSNHFGAWNGGGGTAVLAILGDTGVNPATMSRAHNIFLRRAKRALIDGYGDAAWFWEGHHCGRLSSNTGLVSYLQALRVGAGADYVDNWPGAHWLLTKWLYEAVRQEGVLHNMQQGMYASPVFSRGGMSTGGDFAQGLGIVPRVHRPAVLWFYNHVIDPRPPAEKDYDAQHYPHRAVYALVNWPLGPEGQPDERNPAEVLPTALIDHRYAYAYFRGKWRGDDDCIAVQAFGGLGVIGLGTRTGFAGGIPPNAAITASSEYPERAATVSFTYSDLEGRAAGSLAADFSERCGSPLLMAYVSAKLDRDGRSMRPRPEDLRGIPAEVAGLFGKAEPPPDAGKTTADKGATASGKGEPDESNEPGADAGGTRTPSTRPASQPAARMAATTVLLRGYEVAVGTFQRGPPPPVKVVGEGDAQRIVVGQRKIAFDGIRLALE
jgi:HEAT repeat protein